MPTPSSHETSRGQWTTAHGSTPRGLARQRPTSCRAPTHRELAHKVACADQRALRVQLNGGIAAGSTCRRTHSESGAVVDPCTTTRVKFGTDVVTPWSGSAIPKGLSTLNTCE